MPSTVIAAFTYDPEKSVLRIKFVSGLIYDYFNVPPEVYELMKASKSKGIFMNREIRNKYDYKKVNN